MGEVLGTKMYAMSCIRCLLGATLHSNSKWLHCFSYQSHALTMYDVKRERDPRVGLNEGHFTSFIATSSYVNMRWLMCTFNAIIH